ncbi:hypothetical protein DFQ30_001028 [Apophysomyces sp. BC1015]|nr:hypothetical protein DFQ30_001028 [Apophysomyces sp. BC1015]KAG0183142.1 hypothetical protein DFQ29_009840 [Apophysomyces sp. BC1021]
MKLSSFVILLAIITLTCMHCLAAAEDFVAQDFEESQYGEEDDHRWSQLSDNSYPGRDHGTSGNRDYQAVTPTSPWSSSNDGISLNGANAPHSAAVNTFASASNGPQRSPPPRHNGPGGPGGFSGPGGSGGPGPEPGPGPMRNGRGPFDRSAADRVDIPIVLTLFLTTSLFFFL